MAKLNKSQKRKRSRCAEDLKKKGYSTESAFKICSASVKKGGKKK